MFFAEHMARSNKIEMKEDFAIGCAGQAHHQEA